LLNQFLKNERIKGGEQMKRQGFTLVELAIIIVIIGILAAVAVPAFVDLQTKAKENAAKAGLGTIRSVVAMQYANNVANGAASFPATIEGSHFADGKVPENPLVGTSTVGTACGTGIAWKYEASNGKVTACDANGQELTW